MPLLHIHNAAHSGHKWLISVNKNGKIGVADWPVVMNRVKAGFDVISFDFRGLGETRMHYTAVSEDDPSLALPDFDKAYVNPLSSVLADYVYNSILTGRPYFLQMMEDAEIAIRFSRLKLHATKFEIESDDDSRVLVDAIAATLPGVSKSGGTDSGAASFWADIVAQRQEQWPIQYLLPGGAYIH